MESEVEFLLSTAGQYFSKAPTRNDVLSVFVGIRPLVRAEGVASTAALSRDHTVHIDSSGLVTICGGKWTTYRHMAEDCVNQAASFAQLPERPCVTHELKIHASDGPSRESSSLSVYGSDAAEIRKLINRDPRLGETLHAELPYLKAQVVWAVRQEMARTLEDVLARRTRALFLNAGAALEMAPLVADLMATELGWDSTARERQLSAFHEVAANYVLRT
jgi:glycerol-3-phosphate dehydrogenase